MNNQQLYKMSKFTQGEAFIISQLESGGSNTARLIEKLEQDKNYIKSTELFMKFMVVLYLLLMVVLPIHAFDNIHQALQADINPQWIIFVGSLEIGLFFVIQTVLLLMFNIFFASGVFAKESFEWLTTLPMTRNEVQKTTLFSLFRAIDVPVVAMALIFPIGTGIITQNVMLAFIALGLSLINIIFTFSLLAIAGERLHNLMTSPDSSKKAGIVRIIVMAGYIILLMTAVMMMSLFPEIIAPLYQNPNPIFPLNWILPILAAISFPFSGALLMSSLSILMQQPGFVLTQWFILGISVGLLGYLLITRVLIRYALSRLTNIVRPRIQTFGKTHLSIKNVGLELMTPEAAFFRKEKNAATRDIQMIMWFVIPFVYGFLGLIVGTIGGELPVLNLFYLGISELMLLGGATKTDSDGQAILASLPIIIRDQAKAKIRWFFYILIPAYLLPTLVDIGRPSFGINLLGTLIYIGLGPIFGIGLFELKVVLFGKLRYKYVLDEMHKNNKVLKWIILGAIPIITHIGFIPLHFILMDSGGMTLYAIVFLTMEAVLGVIVWFGFNRLFPRKRTTIASI